MRPSCARRVVMRASSRPEMRARSSSPIAERFAVASSEMDAGSGPISVRPASRTRCSMAMSRSNSAKEPARDPRRRRASASALTPRRIAARRRQSRESDGRRNSFSASGIAARDDCARVPPSHDASSAVGPLPFCSMERSALLSAAPNVRSIAITSPVAFI